MIKQFRKVMTIDPGWTSGWAFFQGDLDPMIGDLRLDPTLKKKEDRLDDLIYKFADLLDELDPAKVYIEETDFRPGSLKSDVSHRMGYIHTLSYLIGSYLTVTRFYKNADCTLLPAISWKGNMNDNAVRARVYSVTGRYYPNPHITDAVGMGLSQMGVFNKSKRKVRHKRAQK